MTTSCFRLISGYWHFTLAAAGALAIFAAPAALAAETGGEFSNSRIDIGIVAKDAARSAMFLTNAIGFKEVRGFAVSPDMGKKIGLVDGYAVNVRVFVLGEGEQATRIKLLCFPDAASQQPNQGFIHSALGIRYLTLYVKDMKRALERLKQAHVPLLGESPFALGGGSFLTTVKDPDGNFLELIGPMPE
jgi:lactoylglutathione lyase